MFSKVEYSSSSLDISVFLLLCSEGVVVDLSLSLPLIKLRPEGWLPHMMFFHLKVSPFCVGWAISHEAWVRQLASTSLFFKPLAVLYYCHLPILMNTCATPPGLLCQGDHAIIRPSPRLPTAPGPQWLQPNPSGDHRSRPGRGEALCGQLRRVGMHAWMDWLMKVYLNGWMKYLFNTEEHVYMYVYPSSYLPIHLPIYLSVLCVYLRLYAYVNGS